MFKMLRGVKVLDISRVLAGPYATMILGDLGADVIKVENPHGGDETRGWGPPYIKSESTYFMSINRNKRSIAVDIRTEKGRDIIHGLAKASDVFVENYIPGKLANYNLDYDSIKSIKNDIIYCSLTGYGDTGPYANRAGYDVIAASVGGLLHITGPTDGEPCRVGVAVTDISTGLYAHGAILGALYERERTGVGQKIDCNLLSTQVAVLSHIASAYLNAGVDAKRWGTAHANIVPYESFKTKDRRFLTIGAGNNKQFANLCRVLEVGDLLADERFNSNHNRVVNRVPLIKVLTEKFLTKNLDKWIELLEDCGFPYGPINDMEHVFRDPQVLNNGGIQTVHHKALDEDIKLAGPAVKFTNHSHEDTIPPPTLGQHTSEILKEMLNLSQEEIQSLYDQSIVK